MKVAILLISFCLDLVTMDSMISPLPRTSLGVFKEDGEK